jgi:hypothetical protein
MIQLLLDSDQPREARRIALHQVGSGAVHPPAHLGNWPRASALEFARLAVRCCNAGDRDVRPTAAELAGALRRMVVEAGEAGAVGLAEGRLELCAAPHAASRPPVAGGSSAGATAAATAKACSLQLELLAGGAVTGTATLQLAPGQQPAVASGDKPGPEPQRVAVSGTWAAATSKLSLKLAAAAVAPTAAAVKQQQVRWPVALEGTYSAGQLQGKMTYHSSKTVAAAATDTTYCFVSCTPAPAAPAPTLAAPSVAEVAAAALAEGLATAGLAAGGAASSPSSGPGSRRCSVDFVERRPSLVSAL